MTFDTDRGLATVVRGLGFSVAAGETVALVGESGSGKSVTALAITRLIDHAGGRISAGRVLFTDRAGHRRDLAQQPPEAMRLLRGPELAMVFQEPMTSLNPVLTVGAQIAEPLMLHQKLDRTASRAEGSCRGNRGASSAAQSRTRKDGNLMFAAMFSARSTLALFN